MTQHPLVWIDARTKEIHAPANMTHALVFNHVLSILSDLNFMCVEVPFEFPPEYAHAEINEKTRPLAQGWKIVQ